MKFSLTLKFASVLFAMSLFGCGGGGTSSPATPPAASGSPTPPGSVTPPVVPPTVAPAVSTISGVVYNALTGGAVVSAYLVQPDGSNGVAIGTSSPTGADGSFSIALSASPSGMVRLVAVGGSYVSEADGKTQTNTALELVTPYVKPDFNFFVMTPLTHMVSRVMAVQAKGGSTLASAFSAASNTAFSITLPNVILPGATNAYADILKTVPGSAADTLGTYKDFVTAVEWYGVRYDLPSNIVVKILAANAEKGFPLQGVDGSNNPINVGKWVAGVFDPAVPFTMDELTAIKDPNGVNTIVNGVIVHDNAKLYIGSNLIQYFYADAACKDATKVAAFTTRYPNYVGVLNDATLRFSLCTLVASDLASLRAHISTNNRSNALN